MPESRLSLGDICHGFYFHRNDHGWVRSKTEVCEVLSLKMQPYGLSQILDGLVEGFALCDYGNFEAFRNAVLLTAFNKCFDRVLQRFTLSGGYLPALIMVVLDAGCFMRSGTS